jgi:acyl carrier protein
VSASIGGVSAGGTQGNTIVTQAEFLESFGEFLSLELDESSLGIALLDGTWDSLAVLSVIGLVEEEWGVGLPPEALARCVTVGDVTTLLVDYFAP